MSNKSIKYLITSFMTIAGSLAFAGFVQAADIEAANQTTGAGSENNVEVELKSENIIDIDNDADIYNRININASTGGNSADKNTGDGSVKTGDANVNVDVTNIANKTSLSLGNGSQSFDVKAQNKTTGAYSENEVEFKLENENKIDVDNDADIDNRIDIESETGENSADKNTGDGSVKTGDASVNLDLSNVANITKIDLCCDENSDNNKVELSNDTTGAFSESEIELKIESENEIDIDNDADIENCIKLEADTGDNSADKNTDDGIVETGDAEVEFDIENVANKTILDLCCEKDDGIDIKATNHKTGYNSENEIEIKIENETELDIDNDLDVKNEINIESETGENSADKNTDDGKVKTGDASLDGKLSTIGNITQVDLCCEDENGVNIAAKNDTTGACSENEIEIDIEKELKLDIDNDADIDNNIDAEVFAGCNTADENTDDGTVETGDAEVDLDVETVTNILNDEDCDSEDWDKDECISKNVSGEGSVNICVNGKEVK